MPKEENPVRPSQKAGAIHRICFSREDGVQEKWELEGVIFEVCILHHRYIPLGMLKASLKCGALPLVDLVEDQSIDQPLSLQLLQ